MSAFDPNEMRQYGNDVESVRGSQDADQWHIGAEVCERLDEIIKLLKKLIDHNTSKL